MFAIIRTGGKQYRVAEQDLITVDKISGKAGDAVRFGEVLLLGGETVVVGSPMVAGATVAGEMVEQGRGEKVIAFKKRRRKNSRRKRGHRQEFSVIRITEILTEGRKRSRAPGRSRARRAARTGAPARARRADARGTCRRPAGAASGGEAESAEGRSQAAAVPGARGEGGSGSREGGSKTRQAQGSGKTGEEGSGQAQGREAGRAYEKTRGEKAGRG